MAYIDWALDLVSGVEDGSLPYCKLESFLVQSSVGLILASQATFGNTLALLWCSVDGDSVHSQGEVCPLRLLITAEADVLPVRLRCSQ